MANRISVDGVPALKKIDAFRNGEMFRKVSGSIVFMLFDPASYKPRAINLRTGYSESFNPGDKVVPLARGTVVTIEADMGPRAAC